MKLPPTGSSVWLGVPVLAVLVTLGFAVGSLLGRPSMPAPVVHGGNMTLGAPAPVFQAAQLGGGEFDLAGHRGQVVLVTFWATWCTACRTELPAMQRLWLARRSQGFAAVAVDYGESDLAGMRGYLAQLGIDFPAVADQAGQIAGAYGVVVGLPVSVLIDRAGRVAYLHVGAVDVATLHDEVGALLL